MPPNPHESVVQIRPNAQKGRSLHAAIPFEAGQAILTLPPLLILPTLSHLEFVCAHCLRAGTPRACVRCRSAYYCDATCQRAAWQAVHSKECKALKRVAAEQQGKGQLPTPVRLLMQVLLLEEKTGTQRAVGELQGHVPATGSKERKDVEMMAVGACVYAEKGTGKDVVAKAAELLCKIQTNAFNYADDDLGQIGVFLEPTLAMANHSCLPNAMVQVIDGKAILRAETPLKAGDEIEISYTDYTWPLAKRRAALEPYKFTCQCLRCKDNLSVYQACALSSPLQSGLLSLVPDSSILRQHPVASDPAKSTAINRISEEASRDIESFPAAQAGDPHLRQSSLRTRIRACKGLLSQDAWAAAPLPHLVTAAAIFFSEQGNFAYGLTLACTVVMDCDPYRYTAPFHPMRARGLYMVTKLLANTAADTAAAMGHGGSLVAAQKDVATKVQETLTEIDQVSLCQMLLILILRLTPKDWQDKWDISVGARAMLEDIRQLQGRDEELSLINSWVMEPQSDRSRAFFQFAVVEPCQRLSKLGKAVLKVEFVDER